MSVLITADLHFSDNPRDDYRFLVVNRLREMIQKYDVKMLLVLGDLTEKKDNHGAWLVNCIIEHFVMLASWCPIIILRGNHDGLDPQSPFFEFLRNFKDISFITHPTEREVPVIGNCLFLPHTSDYKRDWAGINLKDKRYKRIFAHNTFKGASGQHRLLDGIPLDIFRDTIGQVIAGDVHVPQTLGPVTYVGAPYLVDFGDDYRPRVLLEWVGKIGKSIAVPGPQKRLVECTLGKAGVDWPESGLNPGDILKIRMVVTPKQFERWSEIKEEVHAWGKKHDYVIHMVQPVTGAEGLRLGAAAPHRSRLTDDQTLEAYAQQRGIAPALLRRGRKLMERVK